MAVKAGGSLRVMAVDLEGVSPTPPGLGHYAGLYVVFRRNGIPVADATLVAPASTRAPDARTSAVADSGGATLAPGEWETAVARARGQAAAVTASRGRGPVEGAAPLPSLCIAVCTRDRPDALARCLATVVEIGRAHV